MPIDFQRVQGVFHAVAELPRAERAAALNRECGNDAELRRQVEALLQAHDDPAELPAADPEPTGAYVPPVEPGQAFAGRYKLRQKLGEGGMGIVFVADQTEPVQRRVALKIIRAGLDTHRLLARFEQERQALALMDHPNIAKVFDAGMDQAQRPYFAMELVKGLPLTKYCDDAKLSPRERLELFIPVCKAVQHAHQKGIIHRDLKPSNILVGLYDGPPVPKVIDFGVAKAIGPRLTEQSIYTEVGSLIGTLEYMSPEQAELNNLDIDTRSDIYALGVILYELLTGAVPFNRKELEKAGLAEMLRVIKEAEPPKPSTKLSHSGALPTIAAARHTEPKRLTALVRGDLDWIVMKALEKDRGRRYETANGFAMDVQRYLHDEPVVAGPPSARYRLRKFARRNKLALTIAGMFAAALLLGVALLSASTILISRSYTAERKARQQAEANFQRTRAAVDEFFTTVSQSTLFDVPGLQPLRKELLESAVRYYRNLAAEAGEDLSVQAGFAAAHFRLAEVYFEVDQSNDSIREVDAGLDLVEHLLQEHPADADLFRRIGGFWKGTRRMSWTARPPDDRAGAERTLNRFVQVWERLAAENHGLPAFQSDLATAYGSVGTLLGAYSRRGESIQSYRKSIALWESLVRANPEEPEYKVALVQAYAATAAELSRAGHVKSKEAENYLQRAMESWEEFAAQYPAAHRYRAALVNVLLLRGYYCQNLAQLEHAIADFSKAIKLDPNNANTHFELGDACARLGRWDQAQAAMGKAAELDPGNHWYMFHAAVLQIRAGDLAGYRRVCQDMLKQFGDTRQPEVAERTAKTCLLVPDAVADLAPVLRLADRAVTGTEKSSNFGYFVLAKGLAEYRAGRNAEAVNWEERLSPGARNRDTDVAALAVLAMAQHRLGRGQQALAALDKAEAIIAKKMADPGAGRPLGRDWDDWMRCRILLDEAGKLLKKDSRVKNQESGEKPH
jgi:serine/threonine protein kinase/Flp pilus assembly protein TadD